MSETRRAIIRPIRKARNAPFDWPKEVIGEEIEATLIVQPSNYFARVAVGVCGGYLVWHGEAELVRFCEED